MEKITNKQIRFDEDMFGNLANYWIHENPIYKYSLAEGGLFYGSFDIRVENLLFARFISCNFSVF